MGSYCLCKHPKESHSTSYINGKVIPYCIECEECTGFGVVAPRVPRALLLAAEPAEQWTAEELGLTTLLYAWDAALCQVCDWRTSAPNVLARADARCLQCGGRLEPVRIEVHSRESP